MGRPLNSGTVEKHPEKQRLGCIYADRYYSAQFNISLSEARDTYRCAYSDSGIDKIGAPSCPFPFLKGDCAVDIDPKFMNGVVDGLLNTKSVTCSVVPVSYTNSPYVKQPDYIHYECSNCKKTITGSIEFMSYCYHCGAVISKERR